MREHLDEETPSWDVEPWIERAANALIIFFDQNSGKFLRQIGGGSGNHATSTARSLFALLEYLRFEAENGGHSMAMAAGIKWPKENCPDPQQLIDKLKICFEKGIAPCFTDPNRTNFELSHALFAAGMLPVFKKICPDVSDTLRSGVSSPANELSKMLRTSKGAYVQKDEVRSFVTLHAVRALDSCRPGKGTEAAKLLTSTIRKSVLEQLGLHSAGMKAPFDATDLLFATSLLHRCEPLEHPLIERAIEIVEELQAPDGAWATSTYITYGDKGLLYVASYEVGLTIANLCLDLLNSGGSQEAISSCVRILDRVFSLVKSQYIRDDSTEGWANDHTPTAEKVESWCIALVLTLLVRLKDVSNAINTSKILCKYNSLSVDENPRRSGDFNLVFQSVAVENLKPIREASDPFSKRALTVAIENEIISPVFQSWVRRPTKSAILFHGPPGSRKTSLVKAMAKSLGWQLLSLAPSDFLKAGMEGLERTISEVFDDLRRLKRVVILFDECEDFIKKRPSDVKVESRTIGAFLTAGMLPRLQALRDAENCIFVFATNSKPEDLDDASTRPGRFDFLQEIPLPTMDAMIEYVNSKSGSAMPVSLVQAIESSRGTLDGEVNFSHLDKALNVYLKNKTTTKDEFTKILESAKAEKTPPKLVN